MKMTHFCKKRMKYLSSSKHIIVNKKDQIIDILNKIRS